MINTFNVKQIFAVALLFFAIQLHAISQPKDSSPIGAAKNEVLNVETSPCDYQCLKTHLDEGRDFSFLANYRSGDKSQKPPSGFFSSAESLDGEYQRLAALYNVTGALSTPALGGGEKIAILAPGDAVGRYSTIVTNSAAAYFLSMNKPFELRVYDSGGEQAHDLERAIANIQKDGFARVLAALTAGGAQTLANLRPEIEVYIPTVNRHEINYAPDNFYFGAIDYLSQMQELAKYSNTHSVAVLDEPIPLSQKITSAAETVLPAAPIRVSITKARENYHDLFRQNRVVKGSSLVLNTRPERTIIALSQITYNEMNPHSILSTQINFNPLLLSQMQSEDVKNFFVASSIGEIDIVLRDLNLLLRNNSESDPRFSWTVYASTALAAMISQRNAGNKSQEIDVFDLELKNNQVQYPVYIYQIRNSRFVPAPPAQSSGGFFN
ncbi:MAG: hypothetical protein LBU73_07355 [Helicobacteraceae bacterium]|jgi:hypothetical protein|nr:hypothetical protein [Helicobacteraceae bacterium]